MAIDAVKASGLDIKKKGREGVGFGPELLIHKGLKWFIKRFHNFSFYARGRCVIYGIIITCF